MSTKNIMQQKGQALDVGKWSVCRARLKAAVGALPRWSGIWTLQENTIPKDTNTIINGGYVLWFDTVARSNTRFVLLMRGVISNFWGAEMKSAGEFDVTVKLWQRGNHNESSRHRSVYVPGKTQRRRRREEGALLTPGYENVIMTGDTKWWCHPGMIKSNLNKLGIDSATGMGFRAFEERWA